MKFYLILAFIFAIGALNAYQTLGAGYFLYDNVTISAGAEIVAAVDTNPAITLLVIPSSGLGSFINGNGAQTVYNESVGSGIYRIPVSSGSYSVIFQANGPTELAVGASSYLQGSGKLIDLNGQSSYSFTTANYSNLNVTVLASSDFAKDPLYVNISDVPFTISSDAVLEYLNLSVGRGTHSVTLQSQQPEQVFVVTSSSTQLVNPLSEIYSNETYPIGVVSYGLYNISGTLVPYVVSTNQVVGIANITALSATTAGNIDNVSPYGASLQLNVELNTNYNGKRQVYWLQDVADFNTSANNVYFVDNIWNNTLPNAPLSNATFQGSGNVSWCSTCNDTPFYAYIYPYYGINYTLPLDLKLLVFENQTKQGTRLSFAYQLLRNGTQGVEPLVYYDKVLIPGTYNSTILVTPYYTTPGGNNNFGNNYDAELVFAGEASGSESIFNNIGAAMWVYYLDNGTLTPFPSAYTFGLTTAESASGINISPGKYGALATKGKENYLENIIVANTTGLVSQAQYVSNTSTYTAPTTVAYVYTAPGLSAVAQSVVPYLVVAVVVVLILMLVAAILRRKGPAL